MEHYRENKMTDTDKDQQQTIEQCFGEIRQVLRKYECEIYCNEDIEIYNNGDIKFYSWKDFTK